MALLLAANNATTTLAGGIASNAASFNVAAGTGALFPSPTTGQFFAVTLISQSNPQNFEIVYVTTRTTDTFSGVTRGQEGTTPKAFVAGDQVQNFWTAGSMALMTQATQLQQQAGNYAVDSGGAANTYVMAVTPAPASLPLITGAPFRLKVGHTNTGASTLAVTPLAATSITNPDGTTLNPNQLTINHIYEFIYNGTTFDLMTDAYQLLGRANTWTASNTFAAISATSSAISGNETVGGALSVTTSITAGTSITGASVATSGAVNAGTTMSASGNIVTTGARLRAAFGAFGSGDTNAATILSDFTRSTSGGTLLYERLPDGTIIQGNFGITTTGLDFITFPGVFPNTCCSVIACEGAPQGWNGGTGQLFPTIFGTQQMSSTGFFLGCAQWKGTTGGSFQFGIGISYRYIAIGF